MAEPRSGFATTVAADLLERARDFGSEYVGTWAEWVEPRVALVKELALVVAGRGDRSPFLTALATFQGGAWRPGRRVENLLAEEVLVVPEPSAPGLATEDAKRCKAAIEKLPDANALLTRLGFAYMADVVENERQVRDRAVAELQAMQPDARISELERRAGQAERNAAQASAESKRAGASEAALMRENGLLRSELRFWAGRAGVDPETYVADILAEGATAAEAPQQQADAPGEPGAEQLPRGIRQRENGRYEAYLTRAETPDGKQRGVGTFPTVEDAVEAREAALDLAARAKEAEEPVAA